MIPCRPTCPRYYEGCHKTCTQWKTFQEQRLLLHIKKKNYLKYHEEVCSTIIRQCYQIQPSFHR